MALKLVHLDVEEAFGDRPLHLETTEGPSSDSRKFRACLTHWRAQARGATAQTPVNSIALIRALEHIERLAGAARQRNIQMRAQDMITRAAGALLDPSSRDEKLRRLSCELDRVEAIAPL